MPHQIVSKVATLMAGTVMLTLAVSPLLGTAVAGAQGAASQDQPSRITLAEPAAGTVFPATHGRASAPVRLSWRLAGAVSNQRVYFANSEDGPMTAAPIAADRIDLSVKPIVGDYEWVVAATKVPPAGCPATLDDWNDEPGCDLDNYLDDACDGRVLQDPPPRPIACTEYRGFTVAAAPTVASITAAKARRYSLEAMRNNGWASAADAAPYHRVSCHRLSRLRFRCTVSGFLGDGSFRGFGEVWYTTDPNDDQFHYRFLVRHYDEYCYAIHHHNRTHLCSRRETWRQG